MHREEFAITCCEFSSLIPVRLVLLAWITAVAWDGSSMFDSLISLVSLQSAEQLAEFSLGLACIEYVNGLWS